MHTIHTALLLDCIALPANHTHVEMQYLFYHYTVFVVSSVMRSDSTSRSRRILANTAWIVVLLLMMSVTAANMRGMHLS